MKTKNYIEMKKAERTSSVKHFERSRRPEFLIGLGIKFLILVFYGHNIFLTVNACDGYDDQQKNRVQENLPNRLKTFVGSDLVNVPIITTDEMNNLLELQSITELNSLDLSSPNNQPRLFSATVMDNLVSSVKVRFTAVETLNLSGNYITLQGIERLSKAFEGNLFPTLKNLNLSHTYYPLIDESNIIFDFEVQKNPNQKVHRITVFSGLSLALSKVQTLNFLDISHNLITSKEFETIKKYHDSSDIKFLDLNNGSIIIGNHYIKTAIIGNQFSHEGCTLF